MFAIRRLPPPLGRLRSGTALRLGWGSTSLAILAAAASLAMTKPVVLLNRSPSEPPGLYVRTADAPTRGAIIAFRTPGPAFPYADRHTGYLRHRPLLKEVAAGSGDQVCTTGGMLVINGRVKAPIAVHDSRGGALPQWGGCRRLTAGELFVFSARVPNSFDSRYYGPVRRADVLGVYRRLAPMLQGTL